LAFATLSREAKLLFRPCPRSQVYAPKTRFPHSIFLFQSSYFLLFFAFSYFYGFL
jgi:hypothetical protein